MSLSLSLFCLTLSVSQPRMISPQSHRPQPRPSGPRGGPGLFPTPLIPIPQQPLQSLMSPRSPAPHQNPQKELHPPRPHGHTHALPHTHSNQQQQQPKNIHINPHFRGPASSSPVQGMEPHCFVHMPQLKQQAALSGRGLATTPPMGRYLSLNIPYLERRAALSGCGLTQIVRGIFRDHIWKLEQLNGCGFITPQCIESVEV